MDDLARRFEVERPRLRALAYRMLGSAAEADDAVQEAWLRLSGVTEAIDSLPAWLTAVVARIALTMLRSRKRSETHIPDPLVDDSGGPSAEHAALLADSVGLALFVVLETLAPAERVAFVLHDVFAMPFDQIAAIIDRTPAATRQLASRARRRVEARNAVPDADLSAQRSVVDAFLSAAHDGDYDRLLAILAPEVVLRADAGKTRPGGELRGAERVARGASSFSHLGLVRRPALVNGAAGAVCTLDGALFAVMAFTVAGGKIVEIDILRDPDRLARLDISALGEI